MQNKPKLRFKEFNAEWKEGKLEDFSVINPNTSNLPDTFYYIDLECVANGRIVSDLNVINKVNAPSRAQRVLTINDLLYQMVRPYQRNNFLFIQEKELPTVASTGYAQIRTKDNDIRFLYQKLHTDSFVKCAMQRSTGTGYPAINSTDLATIDIKLPEIDEQKKIAEFLSKVDEVISEREEEVKDLEQQKKGLMQKIFSQQLRFTDSNNNPYPDWEDKKIGDVFEFYNGKAHEQEIDENGEYIVVNSKFISTEGQVKKYTNKVICPLKKDDIVLVMSDVPNGKAMSKCYLIEEDNKYSLNQRICCLRTKDVARFFIYQISRNKYFLKFDNGVSQTNLRKEDVLKCPIQVPCLEEQQKIANVLSKLDELIEEKKALLSDWQQFKKGLLQQMFV